MWLSKEAVISTSVLKDKIKNLINNALRTSHFALRYSIPHLGIIFVAIFVLLANLFFSKIDLTLAADDYYYTYSSLDSSQAAKVVESIAEYTPALEENAQEFELALLVEQSNGYLNKDLGNNSVITEIAKKDFEYTVQEGETIMGIAKKFDLHVASLVDKNALSTDDLENLKPGQKLIIPVKDSSDSKEWLVKLNEKKEYERQLAIKAEQERQKKLAAAQKKKLAANYRSTVYRDRSGYDGYSDASWAKPINYQYISRGISRGHSGIDMIAGSGTPVYASKSGKVVGISDGWGSGYGKSILVDHGGGQTSRYAHLSSFAVGVGQSVGQGQVVGYSGNTGWSTGPHLHFEARQNGTPFNPF